MAMAHIYNRIVCLFVAYLERSLRTIQHIGEVSRKCHRQRIGERYWAVLQIEHGDFTIVHVKETNCDFDNRMYAEGNYFASEEAANNAMKQRKEKASHAPRVRLNAASRERRK